MILEKITKYVLVFFILLFVISFTTAYKDVEINVNIMPQEVVAKDFNVVGDIFIYNITLTNKFNETINDTYLVNLIFPDNQTIPNPSLPRFLSISPNETKSIIPYINLSKNNDTYIWQFMTEGDYKIEICSKNQDIKFIKNYNVSADSDSSFSYYYDHGCFKYYFSAMPQWQYDLFQEEKEAAKKEQEANEKLINLTVDLEDATQTMKNATIVMVIVAILTLIVAYFNYKNKK